MKTILAALGMLALSATAYAGSGSMKGISQQVQVESKAGKVLVHLTVDNASDKPVFVPKAVFEDDELFGKLFEIRNLTTGAEVDYIGPMVKRGPFTAEDYLKVNARSKHSNTIDITRSYDFKPGINKYQLTYSGNYLGNLAKLESVGAASIAPVTFTHTGK